MANREHVAVLKQGVLKWNAWRTEHANVQPDLSEANLGLVSLRKVRLSSVNLSGANLYKADLYKADLQDANLGGAHLSEVNLYKADLYHADLSDAHLPNANLSKAHLYRANLRKAHFGGADFGQANLSEANLDGADLSKTDLREAHFRKASLVGASLRQANLQKASFYKADLSDTDLHKTILSDADLGGVDLSRADLSRANLCGADLSGAILVETNLTKADLTGCRVYGTSIWNVNLVGAIQKSLIITPGSESAIQVDDLEMAQFIYLLLNNAKIRRVIDAITSKVVLILGRFTDERKAVLGTLRAALRQRDYLPVLFDFEGPLNRDITETVSILAHMARFVIADITDAKSIPQELMAIVPNLPSVPVQPLLLESQREYGMFEHFKRYPWVLPMALYGSQEELLGSLEARVILPAEAKLREIRGELR